eukprot:gene6033-6734_t
MATIRDQIQGDWENREFVDTLTGSVKKLADFLNNFDVSCRTRLANLNSKLTSLEQKIEYIEARVTRGQTLS